MVSASPWATKPIMELSCSNRNRVGARPPPAPERHRCAGRSRPRCG
jgi:hypothetical protein